MSNKIRKLSIGEELKERFIYEVRSDKPFLKNLKNGKLEDFFLHEIIETENHFNIYLKNKDEVHFWKKEPKTKFIAVEFFLD